MPNRAQTNVLLILKDWQRVDTLSTYDLLADPNERVNQIANPDYAGPAADLREALASWMHTKGDPLLEAFRRMRTTHAFTSVS